MRFRSLSLLAFGPFTGRVLDLSGAGLHVIYGPNEAGKSTALRAVRGLLFGIPERTTDAYLHTSKDLRVGACLELGSGVVVEVIRRKKRKDSLRNGADEPIDERVLAECLGALDESTFDALYGFDHARLKLGGEALVAGAGAIGETLYDAALGGARMTHVLTELRRQARELFSESRNATKPPLNAAIAEYKQLHKRQREELVPEKKYLDQSRACDEARAQVEALRARQRELELGRRRLERVQRLLAPFGLRRQRLLELTALGELPPLAEDAPKRRAAAEASRAQARLQIARLEREIAVRRQSVPVADGLVPLAAIDTGRINRLRDAIGSQRQAAQELPLLESKIRAAEAEIAARLAQLGEPPDRRAAAQRRPTVLQVNRLRARAQAHPLLVEKLRAAEQRRRELARQLTEQREQLEGLASVAADPALDAAVIGARAARGVLAELEARRAELAGHEQRLSTLLAELSRFRGDRAELLALELPADEALDEFETRQRAAAERARAVAARQEELRRELALVGRDRQALTLAGDVPDERQLAPLRERRDAALRAWHEAGRTEAATPGWAEVEELVRQSDELADRLRREATRVADMARLRASEQHLELELRGVTEAGAAARAELEQLSVEWAAWWQRAGVEPGSGNEMRAFARRAREAAALARACAAAERKIAALEERPRAARLELLRILPDWPGRSPEIGLEELLEGAESRLRAQSQRAVELRTRQDAVSELQHQERRAEAECREASAELARWGEAFRATLAELGMAEQLAPDEALALLEVRVDVLARLDALTADERRAEALRVAAERFAADVQELVGRFAVDLRGEPVDRAAEVLVQRCQEAKLLVDKRRRLEQENAEAEQELEHQRAALAVAEQELEALIAAAGQRSLEELVQVEVRCEEALRQRRQIQELEAQLFEIGGNVTIEELTAELEGWDRERAQARLAEIDRELAELAERYDDAKADWESKKRGLEVYAAAQTAVTAQDKAMAGARVVSCLEEYARVRIALHVLEREVEQHRQQHQGPILSRANELFPRLTLGRYAGLRVGLEERVLRCLRDSDEIALNELSEGTSYQLYFALRLATIERQLGHGEPLPLLLDDVLIHFDDDRARVALEVLAELAARTQVLLFTHHTRIVELAREVVHAGCLGVHDLAPRATERAQPRSAPVSL